MGGAWLAQGAGMPDRQHVADLQRAARFVAEPRMQVAAAAAQYRCHVEAATHGQITAAADGHAAELQHAAGGQMAGRPRR